MSEESEAETEPEEPKQLPLPKLGTTLGSYKLVKLLGVGGMGRVYVALHQKLGRKVALKLLLPEFAANPEVVQRFFNEARAVNQISHPNIVEIVDFVEDPHGFNYFIMELLDGKDLRKTRDADGPFLLGRTVATGKQMASALAAAHGQGIIHRDIKPDNVVLMPSEERPNFIKLLDFGIAKLSSGVFHEQKTRLGMVLGTPGYMSPEQAFGRPVDGRSDVYSLGVLLHWMLVDKLPSAGNMPMKAAPKDEPPPDPLRVTARGQPIPTALAELVERCLRFDPDDRVQSMDRVRAALAVIAPTDIRDSSVVKSTATLTDGLPAIPLSLVEGQSASEPGAAGVQVDDQASAGPPGATMRQLPAMDIAAATRLQAESAAENAKDAATRIKLDTDRPIGASDAEAPAQDEAAAFPQKRGGTIWIAAIAAAVVVAVGLVIVLRSGARPPQQIAAVPPAEAAPVANTQPAAPEPGAGPTQPTAQLPAPPEPSAPPTPTAQEAPPKETAPAPAPEAVPAPPHPTAHELTADETHKPAAPAKPGPAEHHSSKTPGKKHGKTKAVDDTSILDPLAE